MSLFMVFKKCEPKVMREGFQIVCKSHKSKKLLVAGQLCCRTKETHFFLHWDLSCFYHARGVVDVVGNNNEN